MPRAQRFVHRPPVEELFRGVQSQPKAARNRLIRQAYGQYGYTLAALAQAMGLHYTTVSKIVNAG